MDNESAKGYLMSALNNLIRRRLITYVEADRVMRSFEGELGSMTEDDAREYYLDYFLVDDREYV